MYSPADSQFLKTCLNKFQKVSAKMYHTYHIYFHSVCIISIHMLDSRVLLSLLVLYPVLQMRTTQMSTAKLTFKY